MRIKTADLKTYMRNYMRVRNGHKARKEPMAIARKEFEQIIRGGGYGFISDAAVRVGVTRNTGRVWLRNMREEARLLAQGATAVATPQAKKESL